jgi:hypothetical protein
MLSYYLTVIHLSKLETNIGPLQLTKCQTLLGFHQFFHECPFSGPGSHLRYHVAFRHHVALPIVLSFIVLSILSSFSYFREEGTSVVLISPFFGEELGFELRASRLQSKSSTT